MSDEMEKKEGMKPCMRSWVLGDGAVEKAK